MPVYVVYCVHSRKYPSILSSCPGHRKWAARNSPDDYCSFPFASLNSNAIAETSQSTRSGRIAYNSTLRVCLINVLSHIFHVLWESREKCWEEPICSCVLNYAFSVRGGKAFRQRLQLPSQGRRPRVCSKQLNPRRGAGSHGGLSGHLSLWMGGQVKPSDSSVSPPASLQLKRAQVGGSES